MNGSHLTQTSGGKGWPLPRGVREYEIFDGSLLKRLNKGFQTGRSYFLGQVLEGTGGIRPLVILPAPDHLAFSFEDGHYTCTFVNADFTMLPVATWFTPFLPEESWYSPSLKVPHPDLWARKLKKEAMAANRKLKRDAYKGRFT